MRFRYIIINICAGLVAVTFFHWGCSPTSQEPDKDKPDLIIQNITYTHPPGPVRGFIICSLTIQNIGSADFYGNLYISYASSQDYFEHKLFSHTSFVYCNCSEDGTAIIPKNASMEATEGVIILSNTNSIMFYIQTDGRGIKDSIMYSHLPKYEESNYDNNFYELTVQK
jgi:hypothetical protein